MAKQESRHSESAATKVALSIAGSDCSAGAGAQADLKTFGAFGVYGLTALTCVVAETPGKVARIEDIGAEIVREQIEVLLKSFPVTAIKTGLLYSGEIIATVAEVLRDRQVTFGDRSSDGRDQRRSSSEPGCGEGLCGIVFISHTRHAKLDETATLLGEPIKTLEGMRDAGEKLTAKYGVPFLLKGGHLAGDNAIDLLFSEGKILEFSAPFLRGVATHGTGCTYSAAITAGLASGWPLHESVQRGKEFVTQAIAQHFTWRSNSGGAIHALNHWPN